MNLEKFAERAIRTSIPFDQRVDMEKDDIAALANAPKASKLKRGLIGGAAGAGLGGLLAALLSASGNPKAKMRALKILGSAALGAAGGGLLGGGLGVLQAASRNNSIEAAKRIINSSTLGAIAKRRVVNRLDTIDHWADMTEERRHQEMVNATRRRN